MTITIKNVTMKNFLSIGNITQSIDFEQEGLTLVLGENRDLGGDSNGSRNGCGKTVVVQAISYAIYGTALNSIKKDNLINCINGNGMLVTLSFSKNDINYRIERGRKPNVLKFFKNDVIQDLSETDDAQGDNRDTQKDLTELIGMSHDMFKHIVALNTYTEPFLSMRANDQRNIIEQLLGITVLSEKADVLKEQIKKTKELIFIENADIEATKKSNDRIQQSIDTLVDRQSDWCSDHEIALEKIAKAIVELEGVDIVAEIVAHEALKSYNELSNKLKSLQKEWSTLKAAKLQAQKTVDKYVIETTALANKKCHACDQELHDHKHETLTETAINNLTEADKYLSKVTTSFENITKEIEDIGSLTKPDTYYPTIEQALTHQNNLKTLETQLLTKANEIDPYQAQIDDLKQSAIQEINWNKSNELSSIKDHQEFLLKLLTNKDSFIRKKIIEQNLAYLNNRLAFYLDKMGLPHTVKFQNDLSVEITQLGQDLDFHNLSRGEMNRVILATSFSFRDVWESLYHGINLLFCDELIDHGMDASGVENALSLFKKMCRERKKNVFLISHKDELSGRVDNILKVIKENNYTSYNIDLEAG